MCASKGYEFVEWIKETARGGARHPSTFRFVCDKRHHRTAKYNDVIDHPDWCCGHCRLQLWQEEHNSKAVMYLTECKNDEGDKFLKLGITGKAAREPIEQQADWTAYTPKCS